jgi:hypothetical protein
MFQPQAKIIADSVNANGDRITTFEIKLHRFILAEFNTHRVNCLTGDSKIYFDMPSGLNKDKKKVYSMAIKDFVKKWQEGTKERPNKAKRSFNFSLVDLECIYDSKQLCLALNALEYYHNLNAKCRLGLVPAYKLGRKWMIKARDFKDFAEQSGTNKQKNHQRLKQMSIRQINEITGEVQHATVKDCFVSGVKQVFKLIAGSFSVRSSADHLIFTRDGWKRMKDIVCGQDLIAVATKKKEDDRKLDPLRFKKIDGAWTCKWNKVQREKLIAVHGGCELCSSNKDLEVHHIVPIHENDGLAFDDSNIQLLCERCHKEAHKIQGWQTGNSLNRNWVKVDSITPDSIEETYDLEINGEFPNFLANNIVVHNSRNFQSSRACPVEKMIANVIEDNVYPLHWGRKQKGMVADLEIDEADQLEAIAIWDEAREAMIGYVRQLLEIDVHKQVANRLLEPFMAITGIVTATDYSNFFNQRCHPSAQPEIRALADAMKLAYEASVPATLQSGQWHIPYVDISDRGDWYRQYLNGSYKTEEDILNKIKVATGCCARVSYLNHDGKRDIKADIALHDRLLEAQPPHLSPFEHCAIAKPDGGKYANFVGWQSYRNQLEVKQAAIELDKELRVVIRAKDTAINENRFDDAADLRDREIEIKRQINLLRG